MKRQYRIAVLGASASGKTSLIRRFISDEYSDMYDPTIEDRYKKTMIYKGKPAHLQIVDTAGKELVCEMMSRYILSADAFMVIYSVGSRKSFEHALYIFSQIARLRGVDSYILGRGGERIENSYDNSVLPMPIERVVFVINSGSRGGQMGTLLISARVIRRLNGKVARLLVAAMCDSDYREVSPEEGNTLSAQLHCSFAEASAKRNVNIEEVFEEMVSQLRYIETTSWKKEHASHRLKSSLCCFL